MSDEPPVAHQCCIHTQHCYAKTLCPECYPPEVASEVGTIGEGAWRITRDDDGRVVGVEIWLDTAHPEQRVALVERTERVSCES